MANLKGNATPERFVTLLRTRVDYFDAPALLADTVPCGSGITKKKNNNNDNDKNSNVNKKNNHNNEYFRQGAKYAKIYISQAVVRPFWAYI